MNSAKKKMDKTVFEQQARTWRQKALSVGLSCGAGRDEAEDIAQDVMLRLWQMHDELERYDSIEALTTLMTRHLLINHQRRRKPEAAGDEGRRPVADETPGATAHHTTHLIIYATSGAEKSRGNSPTIGNRNHISKYTLGKGTKSIIRRHQT